MSVSDVAQSSASTLLPPEMSEEQRLVMVGGCLCHRTCHSQDVTKTLLLRPALDKILIKLS